MTKATVACHTSKNGGTYVHISGIRSFNFSMEQFRDITKWKCNQYHGNHDRMTWDSRKTDPTKEQSKYLSKMHQHLSKVFSSGFDLARKLGIKVGQKNFANHYKSNSNRTFWHRDRDFDPGCWVVVVSLGATRTLTFVDYRTDEVHKLVLKNGDIVAFDFDWNMNHFHAVEEAKDETGERISIQFFTPKTLWTKYYQQMWKETAPLVRRAIAKRRTKVKKLLANSKRKKSSSNNVENKTKNKISRKISK